MSNPPQTQISSQVNKGTKNSNPGSTIESSNLRKTNRIHQARTARVMQRKAGNARLGRVMSMAPIQQKAKNPSLYQKKKVSVHSPIIQKRSFDTALTETNVIPPPSYTEIAGAGTLVGGGPADLVVATNLQESRDMERALNQAATRFGKVGDATKQIMKNPVYNGANGMNFVPFANGATANGVEPFIYRIKVPYKKNSKNHQISLDYQMANPYRGYIVKQKDSGDTSNSEISVAGVTNPKNMGQVDSFNMQHADTGGQALSTNLFQDDTSSRETNEARIDARTKIAGEGARWLLVRNNSGKIANNSRIWTRYKGKVYSVSFTTLWLNWLNVFDSEYDIPDSVVANELVNNNNWSKTPDVVNYNRWGVTNKDIQVQ